MSSLNLPHREIKPRNNGLNVLIDNGYPLSYFTDIINSMSEYIDFVKFGWCTSLLTKSLQAKIDILKQNNIDYFFGGTLFEKYLYQNKMEDFKKFVDRYECQYIEISNGTIDIDNTTKCKYIKEFSQEYKVLSEVGLKDSQKSEEMSPKKWIQYIQEDRDSGAFKVITEARESGTSGICRSNGDLRVGLFEEILESDLNISDIIFEAPNKSLQIYFIKKLGTNCNLANIAFADVIGLETLRLGLRSDTFFTFDKGEK